MPALGLGLGLELELGLGLDGAVPTTALSVIISLIAYNLLLTIRLTSYQGVERDHQPHGLRRPPEELEAGEVRDHEARPECEAAHQTDQTEEPWHRHRALARHLTRSAASGHWQVAIGKSSLLVSK